MTNRGIRPFRWVVHTLTGLVLGCSAQEAPPLDSEMRSQQTELTPCQEAFAAAAKVPPMQDSHSDLFPAFTSCESMAEFGSAAWEYPDAVPMGDSRQYAINLCVSYPAELADSPVCKTTGPRPTENDVAPSLPQSAVDGMLGLPLPEGSRLTNRGSSNGDRWEEYEVSASEADIDAFYAARLPATGWSEDAYLPGGWVKGGYLAVVITREGSFTLRGS